MRRPIRFAVLVFLWFGLATMVRAQGGMNVGNMAMPAMGPLSTQTGTVAGAGKPGASKDDDPALSISDTFVSFIESAVPRNVVGLRFDATYGNRQPMRATYLFAKGGVPNSVGFPLPAMPCALSFGCTRNTRLRSILSVSSM